MKQQHEMETITRRDFLKGTAYGTVGMALGLEGLKLSAQAPKGVPFAAASPVSRVVLVRNERALDASHKINAKLVAEMIDSAVKALSGESDVVKAWQHYFRPQDMVGIKYTRCEWHRVHTDQAVIDAIVARLAEAGVAKARLKADDYGLPLRELTALINVPTIKVHALTGLACAIKNYINFAAQPSAYHHEGSGKLPETWLLPEVKGKTRLIIVDALRPYFGPGPQINPLHHWDYKAILVGTDPVAVDTVCLRIAQAKRNLFKGEEWVISPPPKSVAAADTVYHLGTSDPLKIQLIRQGWEKDILI